jgi:hypothetical protein
MTTHWSHQSENVTRAFDLIAQHHWGQKLRESGPTSVSPFVAVEGSFARSAFSPSLGAIRIRHAREDDAAFSSATETGFEKVDERQANFAQFNRRD